MGTASMTPMIQTPSTIVPPFTADSAARKVRAAEDAWNSRDPDRVALAYTEDSAWRNRSEFVTGRDQIRAFLADKWAHEHDYRLAKALWAFTDNRIAVRFRYEWHDEAGNWFRSYGNELWEFDEAGLMRRREASINDVPIREQDRSFFWPAPGPRTTPASRISDDPDEGHRAWTERSAFQPRVVGRGLGPGRLPLRFRARTRFRPIGSSLTEVKRKGSLDVSCCSSRWKQSITLPDRRYK
jgi:uncharacterized protein